MKKTLGAVEMARLLDKSVDVFCFESFLWSVSAGILTWSGNGLIQVFNGPLAARFFALDFRPYP